MDGAGALPHIEPEAERQHVGVVRLGDRLGIGGCADVQPVVKKFDAMNGDSLDLDTFAARGPPAELWPRSCAPRALTLCAAQFLDPAVMHLGESEPRIV